MSMTQAQASEFLDTQPTKPAMMSGPDKDRQANVFQQVSNELSNLGVRWDEWAAKAIAIWNIWHSPMTLKEKIDATFALFTKPVPPNIVVPD